MNSTKLPLTSGYIKEAHELSAHLLPFPTLKLRENRLRIDSESILNQFSTVHRLLPVAITFDPELRLTHHLRLCGAYHLLYASNLGLRYGYQDFPAQSSFSSLFNSRIGRARSSLVIFLETKKLMVVLGCSKGGETAFGMPLSVGIQNCSRASVNRFYLQQSRFSEPFSKKNGISRAKNRFP
ncbi:hypothetical protein PIB30_080670 [Stylosanthes scabra]|uniref:Uncharacterized protein n=1 Tax=Stylosanthes scabra TaxID=79078 RepID=A0ABU6TS32_9FABA|nr:hypothetical protein [Stylosanthes scabra]